MSYRFACFALLVGLVASGCSKSSTSPTATAAGPKFTAALNAANEVPAVTNADATGSGTATMTMTTFKDTAGNITVATMDFTVSLTGFPAGTVLTGAHIHPGASGTTGSVIVQTGLASGEITLSNGAGSITKGSITVTPELAQAIINGPAGYYFNVHTTLNSGGAVRGQLVRAN